MALEMTSSGYTEAMYCAMTLEMTSSGYIEAMYFPMILKMTSSGYIAACKHIKQLISKLNSS